MKGEWEWVSSQISAAKSCSPGPERQIEEVIHQRVPMGQKRNRENQVCVGENQVCVRLNEKKNFISLSFFPHLPSMEPIGQIGHSLPASQLARAHRRCAQHPL